MTPSRIYHVGIVVDALAPAMERLGGAAGVTWGRVQRFAAEFGTPSGRRTFDQEFALSLEGPPYIELLVRVPGSVWERTGLHHLGMWSDDVPGESAGLEGRGCAWEAALLDADGRRAGGCYHVLPDVGGARVENYLAGGDYR